MGKEKHFLQMMLGQLSIYILKNDCMNTATLYIQKLTQTGL